VPVLHSSKCRSSSRADAARRLRNRHLPSLATPDNSLETQRRGVLRLLSCASTPATGRGITPLRQLAEPNLVPKLRFGFADFPYLHCSKDQRLLTLETCCGYGYGLKRRSYREVHTVASVTDSLLTRLHFQGLHTSDRTEQKGPAFPGLYPCLQVNRDHLTDSWVGSLLGRKDNSSRS
jgi:hypothetical protein